MIGIIPLGKKDKDTLRVSSVTLLSGLESFNIFTLIAFISIQKRHMLISKEMAVVLFGVIFIFNLLLISSKKSETLRDEYQLLESKKRINLVFYTYLLISIFLLVFILAYTAYFKNKYGNFDH